MYKIVKWTSKRITFRGRNKSRVERLLRCLTIELIYKSLFPRLLLTLSRVVLR